MAIIKTPITATKGKSQGTRSWMGACTSAADAGQGLRRKMELSPDEDL
jgi:hypothetical protein